MPELLLELFSEEIPARMQARAAEDLRRLVTEGLKAQGLEAGEAKAYATPRRLTLVIDGVPARSPDISEERKGPRVTAPEQAIAGFVKSAGLTSIKEAQVVKDEKKGDFYVVRVEKPGRAIEMVLLPLLTQILANFPWPKSMRWGAGSLSWVRPLRSMIFCLDGRSIELNMDSGINRVGLMPKGSGHNPDFPTRVPVGNITRGHRFHGNTEFSVKGFADYVKQLRAHKVILDATERMDLIASQARALAKEHKLALVEDEALLAENAGLTEWPTVLMGTFDEAFLEVPAECLMLSMKQHLKYFSLKHPRTGRLANKFLLVSNLIAKDGGRQIVAGNEKVIAARLSDARFFWEQDKKKPLDEMAAALAGITFHEKLGSQKERVERVAELSFQIAGSVDAVPEDARRAAQLAKADLVSGMVGEFPELQGLMGRYYAQAAGTKPEIARAIELHYKPKGPSDTVPKVEEGDAVAVAVALADKLDTLVGFWAIGEKPTGSGDPYQLRRAALGVIRIVLENDLRLPLRRYLGRQVLSLFEQLDFRRLNVFHSRLSDAGLHADEVEEYADQLHEFLSGSIWVVVMERSGAVRDLQTFAHSHKLNYGNPALSIHLKSVEGFLGSVMNFFGHRNIESNTHPEDAKGWRDDRARAEVELGPIIDTSTTDLLAFFADRLKVHLRDAGARHDLIDAVFSLGGQDDLALIVKRVEALGEFLKTDDGAVLLTGVKRATNILRDEEKKDKKSYAAAPDAALLREVQEKALHAAIQKVKKDTAAAINVENFAGAMRALAELRAPVDAFFDKVTVNAPDAALRANRLALLSEIRAATLNVADFSKIAG